MTSQAAAAVASAKPVIVSQLQKAARAKILSVIHDGSIDPNRINPQTLPLAKAIAAEQAAVVGSAARKKASKAVALLEKKLSRELEKKITDAVPGSVGGSADWVDPFVGARVQHYLTERLYFVALADVGGFGGLRKKLGKLEKWLGRHHDLVILDREIRALEIRKPFAKDDRKKIRKLIGRRAREFEKRSARAGRKLFRQPSSDFVAAMHKRWKRWESGDREPA